VRLEECRALLKSFFAEQRAAQKSDGGKNPPMEADTNGN